MFRSEQIVHEMTEMTNFRCCHFDFHRDLHHDDMMILSVHLYSRINGTEMKAAPGEAALSAVYISLHLGYLIIDHSSQQIRKDCSIQT